MKFRLVDRVITQTPESIIVVKQVSLAEEYLADHFPSFPVLPGVMMIETMVQAARHMLAQHEDVGTQHLVLGEVQAVKFGNMVRPGEQLEMEVALRKRTDEGHFACKGIGRVRRNGEIAPDAAVSGKFTMRPVRLG